MNTDESRDGIRLDDTVLDRDENDDNYYIQEGSFFVEGEKNEDSDQNFMGQQIHTY